MRMSGSVFDPNFEFNAPKVGSLTDEKKRCPLAPSARRALLLRHWQPRKALSVRHTHIRV